MPQGRCGIARVERAERVDGDGGGGCFDSPGAETMLRWRERWRLELSWDVCRSRCVAGTIVFGRAWGGGVMLSYSGDAGITTEDGRVGKSRDGRRGEKEHE